MFCCKIYVCILHMQIVTVNISQNKFLNDKSMEKKT